MSRKLGTRGRYSMSNSAGWPSTQMTLLSRLREPGDNNVWEEFSEIYAPLIYGYCRYRQLQHADALDVSQNALVALRCGLHNYDPAKGKFRGWFCQIIWAEIARFRRKQFQGGQAVGGDFELELAAGPESDLWEEQFKNHVVNTALTRLKAEIDPLEVVVLDEVVVKGRKPRNLVTEVGRDAAWISRAKYRLMSRLKELVYFYSEGGFE